MKRRNFLKLASLAPLVFLTPLPKLAPKPQGTLWTTHQFEENVVIKNGGPLEWCIAERWAEESLSILEENMIISELIHRDFI